MGSKRASEERTGAETKGGENPERGVRWTGGCGPHLDERSDSRAGEEPWGSRGGGGRRTRISGGGDGGLHGWFEDGGGVAAAATAEGGVFSRSFGDGNGCGVTGYCRGMGGGIRNSEVGQPGSNQEMREPHNGGSGGEIMDRREDYRNGEGGAGAEAGLGQRIQRGTRQRGGGQKSEGEGGGGDMEVGSEPSNTSRHQTIIPASRTSTPNGVEQGRIKGPHLPTHGQRAHEGVVVQDRESESPLCACGGVQNAAHLLASGCMVGKVKRWEDIWQDREFCAEVTRFLGGV